MNKTMTVDLLSSIKGAKPSDTVSKLFEIIKNANASSNNFYSKNHQNSVSLDELREDIVIESSDLEKKIIIENFPKEKKGYLVVSKVIEE
jgi:Asp-tRNA(Asn)/Glu-tRNA(Gln) amidotransferase C subunit